MCGLRLLGDNSEELLFPLPTEDPPIMAPVLAATASGVPRRENTTALLTPSKKREAAGATRLVTVITA